ncbi:MAG: aspartyl/asparaginyl beta-hydroxylase domain-containing protein [Gammaproteobacteria bacterium]
MKCAEPMRHLGAVEIAPFVAALATQPESLWDADGQFQKQLAPYRKSRTIYLLMTVGGPLAPTRELAGWAPLQQAFAPIAARIAEFYPRPGRVLNAQVALLGPGLDIPEHVDFGPTLEATHRVHVPLETHPEVQFIVEDQNIALQVGEAYELDNMRRHRVFNPSPFRRIHIIVDYYEEPVPAIVAASVFR